MSPISVLVAHQPAYWPWPGYFSRLLDVGRLVVLDHVQFSERGFQHRNTIAGRDGRPARLTVPVHRRFGQRLNTVRIADEDFGRRHWRTLNAVYGRAPYWQRYADGLEALYAQRWTRLVPLSEATIRLALGALEMDVRLEPTSSGPPGGTRTAALTTLCRQHGAEVLRVGTGALGYLDTAVLADAGIGVEVATYTHPPYGPGGRRPAGLSVLDLLLHEGPRARAVLEAGARTHLWNPTRKALA
ncbi:WbqC family protein [Streptomyces katsurahamanus]|uniref:WbqC family protein n=1 Tax=Streptomyces katsurahamanus TaxID=2577098 RepID=A0ABW9NYS3_9ACTN|nr:WbqC family protein [Streptomyces katsurahamanus]MQS38309.1 WbqC family protein [Streptomyces katsurahamanus]